ncbi:hypothetical protein MMYC01_203121 [Madurella mycetomatis]|uniref:Uncharacterized protein n=1 Tax=Madurella mycetomatis TaxID=100816 RepID=A0A175W7W5_9PEZI|nr:hypothetical protein MMYC01_203121 [Madurella mycetomatis]
MAPVAVEKEPGYLPLLLAASHGAAAVYFSCVVGVSLYRSQKALGPAHDTRHRIAQRLKLTTAFGSLAALGLVFATTSAWAHLTLSYNVWASERGIRVPDWLSESHATSTNGTDAFDLQIRRWLNDTPVYLDTLEIIAEKSRRLWWGQQLDLATVSWTTLLAIEGRRRRIPHLWAYALLPHLISLSFAQNLFYVALLLTPSPNPARKPSERQFLDRIFPQKPDNWFPKLPLLLAPLILSYAAIAWLPFTAETAWFSTAVTVSKLLSLAPLMLPAITPESWGTVRPDPHDAYRGITKLFNVASVASILLHTKATTSGLFYNIPESYKHRHSIKIPFDTEKRSQWERSATAVEKVLGSMADHPAVAAAGKDVLLSAVSLGLWAAVRAVDVSKMLRSAFPIHHAAPNTVSSEDGPSEATTKSEPEPSAREQSPKSVPPLGMILRRRRRRPTKTSVSSISSIDEPGENARPAPRRRGRPRKVKPEPEPEEKGEVVEDGTYEPTPDVKAEVGLGDVVPDDDFDWESAALAWGLTALGGLGVGSAAVFGAECVSR